jgi:hypothetical protein
MIVGPARAGAVGRWPLAVGGKLYMVIGSLYQIPLTTHHKPTRRRGHALCIISLTWKKECLG